MNVSVEEFFGRLCARTQSISSIHTARMSSEVLFFVTCKTANVDVVCFLFPFYFLYRLSVYLLSIHLSIHHSKILLNIFQKEWKVIKMPMCEMKWKSECHRLFYKYLYHTCLYHIKCVYFWLAPCCKKN